MANSNRQDMYAIRVPPATSERAVVALLAASAGLAALAQTTVVPLLGQLPGLLHASPADTSWVVTAALLSGAVTSPVIGRLGDLYGRRRLVLIVLGLLAAGSLLCAVAWSLPPMIAGRALQGMAMSLIPLGISLLRDVLSPQRVGSAIALTSSVLGVGSAFGLPLAAVIAEYADWQLLFAGTGVLAAVAAVLVGRLVPDVPGAASGGFDLAGALTLTAGLTALLLTVSRGGQWGWASAPTLASGAGAAVLLALWVVVQRRAASPLIDLRSATRRPVLLVNAASAAVGFAMYGQILMVPQLMQLSAATGYGLGLTMTQAGLWMLPAGLAMMTAAPFGARLSAARGPKAALLLGTVLIGLGYLVCVARLESLTALVAGTVVTNAGVGFAFGAAPALIMAAVPREQAGAANGLNTLLRSIGSAVAGAVVGAALALLSTSGTAGLVPSRGAFVVIAVAGIAASALASVASLLVPAHVSASPERQSHV